MCHPQCGAGLVPIRRDGTRLAFAAPLIRSGEVSAEDLTEIVSFLDIGRDVVVDAQWADNGPGWVALLLTDAETVLALHLNAAGADRWRRRGDRPVSAEVGGGLRSPAFTLLDGLGEDPVTGSLNAALGQWLIGAQRAPSSYVAAQGTAIGRRGRVHVSQVDGDVWVGGDTVTGVTGTVHK